MHNGHNPMSRRAFLQQVGAGIAGMALAGALPQWAEAQQARKWNVLFIAVDDLSARLGCYGHPLVKSPNIDCLAARGVQFGRAYCQYPLCNPSRTSLLTGRYPTTTQVMDNLPYFRDDMPDAVTLPEHFRANGYVSARTGKIFHGGIDDEKSWVEGGEPRTPRQPITSAEQEQYRRQSDRWVAVEGEGEDQGDYRTASRAVELLEKYKDKLFFLAVGFVKPHSALIAPRKYFDLYDPAKIQLPPDFAPKPTVGSGVPEEALPPQNGDLFIGREASPSEAREMIAAYFACISFMDAQVGRVLDTLERLNLRDNTVIVFSGDHGYHLGEKGKWSKHSSLYEVVARVPLIVAVPSSRGRRHSPRTVELLDIYPTLVELCGLPMPRGLEGQSLVPVLDNPDTNWDHPAYTVARRGNGRSVRTERYRYTEWDEEGKKAELYDHQADPHELCNLAGAPKHVAVVKELRALLRAGLRAASPRR